MAMAAAQGCGGDKKVFYDTAYYGTINIAKDAKANPAGGLGPCANPAGLETAAKSKLNGCAQRRDDDKAKEKCCLKGEPLLHVADATRVYCCDFFTIIKWHMHAKLVCAVPLAPHSRSTQLVTQVN